MTLPPPARAGQWILACLVASLFHAHADAAPPNDNFVDRIVLTNSAETVTGSNVGATREPGEPNAAYDHSVWWSWAAPASGRVEIKSGGLLVSVYTGSTIDTLVLVTQKWGSVTFDAVRGTAYQVMASSWSPEALQFDLKLVLGEIAPLPGRLFGPTNVPITVVSTSSDTVLTEAEVFFSLASYQHPTGSLGKVVGPPFTTVWTNVPFGTYWLSARAVESTGVISTSAPVRLVLAPPNDDFTNRFVLSGALVVTNVVVGPTSIEPDEPTWNWLTNLSKAWFEWTAPASGLVSLSATGQVNVFRGDTLATLQLVASPSFQPVMNFMATAGETYQISVGGFPNHQTETVLRIELYGAPPNDCFADRIALSGSSVTATGSNFVVAAREPGEPQLMFGFGRTVWWTWTAPASGVVSLTTAGSTFKATLGVFKGSSLEDLEMIYTYYGPEASFYAIEGQSYEIAVDGIYPSPMGYIDLRLNLTPLVRSANDDFADRISVTESSFTIVGSNVAATRETEEPQHGDYTGQRSVWYSWTAPSAGSVRFDISGTNLNPQVGIYSGTTLTALQRVANYPCFLNPSGCRLGFTAAAGETYQIAIDGASGGDFRFQLQFIPPVANDDFVNRIPITSFPTIITSAVGFASVELGEPRHAPEIYASNSVWYSWVAPVTGPITIEVAGQNMWAAWLGIYTGSSVDNLIAITNKTAYATFIATAGVMYQIAVATDYPPFTLRISGPPSNDSFASRIALSGTNIWFTGTTRGATSEPGEPNPDPYNNYFHRTAWWTWTAPISGPVRVRLYGEINQPVAAVYTGDTLAALTLAAASKYDGDLNFFARQGTVYHLQLDGFGGGFGDMNLWLGQTPQSIPAITPSGLSRLPDGSFQVQVTGDALQSFALEASADLKVWTTLFTNALPSNSSFFVDTNASALPQRFYRLRQLP